LVPATAEYVFEGEILPDAPLVSEGPFGEYTGYYGLGGQSPEVRLTAVTHRANPVFQGTLEGMPPSESTMLRVPGATAGAWAKVRGAGIPGVKDIHLTDMGCASYFCVVSLGKQFYYGHAREVVSALWAGKPAPKWIVLVDEDVDVYDRGQVEWAMATRVQPHRDIWVTPQNQRGINLDPAIHPDDRAHPITRTSRVAIDATEQFKGYDFEPLANSSADLRAQVLARWAEFEIPLD
jgi:UbiD family decarboxylase